MALPRKGRNVRRGSARRGTHRPWCLPPAVTREPGETLEGMHVLDEFPAELSLLLWSALRDVSLWALTPEERREGLFSPNTAIRRADEQARTQLDPALELHLGTLAGVVSHPAQASDEVVTLTCLAVSRWAREHGGMGTAVAFAQAAALASPEDPEPALAVGRLAVEWGRPARAETWLRRAIGLARRARDWECYGAANVALGDLSLRAERLPAAERFYVYAMRAARRQQLRVVGAEALHGLMRVRMAAGDDLEAAERYGRLARRRFGRLHPRVPELEMDMARLFLARGEWERAAPLLRRLLGVFTEAGRRMVCHAMLAHAAAAQGDPVGYERSWKEAWNLKEPLGTVPHTADALVHLGRAAALTHDWLRVQQTVRAFNDLRPDLRPGPPAAEMTELAGMVRDHRSR